MPVKKSAVIEVQGQSQEILFNVLWKETLGNKFYTSRFDVFTVSHLNVLIFPFCFPRFIFQVLHFLRILCLPLNISTSWNDLMQAILYFKYVWRIYHGAFFTGSFSLKLTFKILSLFKTNIIYWRAFVFDKKRN